MPNYNVLQVLIFLIPGFIAEMTFNVLVHRKEKRGLAMVVEALVFTMFIYTIYAFIWKSSPVTYEQGGVGYDWRGFLILTVVSIAMSIVFSFSVRYDIHMRLARWFKISSNTSRSSTWKDVFEDKVGNVIVNFADGNRLFGWPEYCSNDPESPLIYLKDPQWIDENQNYIKPDVDGILIAPTYRIETIEFLKLEEDIK